VNSRNDEILAQCLEAIENGMSIEECLVQFPDQSEELLPLLEMTQAIRSDASQVAVRAQFRRSAQSQLLARLPERRVTFWSSIRHTIQSAFNPPARRYPAVWAVLIAVAIIVFSGGGVVYASSNALPGDALYGVKAAVESTLLFIASDDLDMHLHSYFANRRLDEMEALAAMGREADLQTAIDGYVKELEAINQGVSQGEESSDLPGEKARSQERLETLLDKVPEQAKEHIQHALDMTQKVPPGYSWDFLPPGLLNGNVPLGQLEDFVPPGQLNDNVPPGQSEEFIPPGQLKKTEGSEEFIPPGQLKQTEESGQSGELPAVVPTQKVKDKDNIKN
jgi:hypothetical protein